MFCSNAFAGNKFSDWLNSFGLSKPIVQDKLFYMGITPTGEPNKLLNIFAILISMINEDVYSEDKRYFARYGCKPHDCGNKGILWIDLKKKVAIGVIIHHFWEKQDFIGEQIFIFSNFFELFKSILPMKLSIDLIIPYSYPEEKISKSPSLS